MRHYGDRLRISREKKELKQIEVAKIIGVANNTLSTYESGKYEPSFDVLLQLCDLYGVSLDYILRGAAASSKTGNTQFQSLVDDISCLSDADMVLVTALIKRLSEK